MSRIALSACRYLHVLIVSGCVKLTTFARRNGGVAAVEFAMVLPFMLLAYVGVVEVQGGVAADRKLANLSLTLANLTARNNNSSTGLQDSDVNAVFNAAAAVLSPYNYNLAGMVITSFVFDSSASPKAYVVWSSAAATGGTAMTASCSTAIPTTVVPANIRIANGSVILGQATFPYNPAIGYVFTGTINLSEQSFMMPRTLNAIPRTNSSGTTVCNCASGQLSSNCTWS